MPSNYLPLRAVLSGLLLCAIAWMLPAYQSGQEGERYPLFVACSNDPQQRSNAGRLQGKPLRGLWAQYGAQPSPRWLTLGFKQLTQTREFAGVTRWDLKVLSSGGPNAFASADGGVYLTQGLLDNAGLTQAEVLAIVAHELAHIELGHGLQAHCAALYDMQLDTHALEYAADREAVKILKDAGLLSEALRTALAKLSKQGGPALQGAHTHPATPDRVQALFRLRSLGG